MPTRSHLSALALAFLAFVPVLSGCASVTVPPAAGPSSSAPSTSPTMDPAEVPGSTLDVAAVTAEPPTGLDLAVVVSSEADAQEQSAVDAVRAYAEEHQGAVALYADASPQDAVTAALARGADVVVGIGPAVVGAIDRASASNPDVSFLVLGTQLAEPTGNVIAVTWPGADERAVFADEELMFSGADTHADEAIATGLAAFWSDLAGHVIALG